MNPSSEFLLIPKVWSANNLDPITNTKSCNFQKHKQNKPYKKLFKQRAKSYPIILAFCWQFWEPLYPKAGFMSELDRTKNLHNLSRRSSKYVNPTPFFEAPYQPSQPLIQTLTVLLIHKTKISIGVCLILNNLLAGYAKYRFYQMGKYILSKNENPFTQC